VTRELAPPPVEARAADHDLDAEASVVGAMLLSKDAIAEVTEIVRPADFYRGAHRTMFEAIGDLRGRGVPVDPVTLADELLRRGLLDDVGGPAAISEVMRRVPTAASAQHYARIVTAAARRRREEAALADALAGLRGVTDPDQRARILAGLAPVLDAHQPAGTRDRAVPGGAFSLDAPAAPPAVWGRGQRVLWAQGEPFLLVGPPGVGKTTVAQQLALARIGLRDQLLGLPVTRGAGRVLYVAADRPAQAARSLRRMVGDQDRATLDDRLVVWRGPLPFDVCADPGRLLRLATDLAADTVLIDSLKDIAPGLEKPEVGAAVNVALQALVGADIDVAAGHHQRKATEGNRRPRTLDDVYGSVWLTAGAGSVVLLWGQAGDPIVELHHLKQPAEDCGPLTVGHDHHTGTSSVRGAVDTFDLLRGSNGITARGLAELIYVTPDPDRAQIAKARRQLDRLVSDGHAHRNDGTTGGHGGSSAAVFHAIDTRRQGPR
jgi:replicative DNA helicase